MRDREELQQTCLSRRGFFRIAGGTVVGTALGAAMGMQRAAEPHYDTTRNDHKDHNDHTDRPHEDHMDQHWDDQDAWDQPHLDVPADHTDHYDQHADLHEDWAHTDAANPPSTHMDGHGDQLYENPPQFAHADFGQPHSDAPGYHVDQHWDHTDSEGSHEDYGHGDSQSHSDGTSTGGRFF